MIDHDAMRAARDRWLADLESAGTGKAFEAGWSARDGEVAALTIRAEASEARVRHWQRFRDNLIRGSVYQAVWGLLYDELSYSPDDAAFTADRIVQAGWKRGLELVEERLVLPIAADPPTPTGEATTGERR